MQTQELRPQQQDDNSSSFRRIHILQQHLQPSTSQHLRMEQLDNVLMNNGVSNRNLVNSHGTSIASLNRAVLIKGVRTPFIKAFGPMMKVDSIGLGVAAVGGLLNKTKLDPNHIDEIIWGNVVLNTKAPNIAREIILDLNLPKKITGVTVSRACHSGLEAILQGVRLIEHGAAECVIAGGSDSMSNGEICLPRQLTHALGIYQYGPEKGLKAFIKFLQNAGSPLHWIPEPPAIAERSTGHTMGYHADLIAENRNIRRESQDAFAMASHLNAARARKEGKFADEIVPVVLPNNEGVITEDNLIREKQDPAKMSKLKPVFRKQGTVTAASSSPLTDGGSCVLIMSEKKALELGYPIDIVVKSYATTAIDPYPELLLAPTLAIPKALDNAGLTLKDIDLFEIHEAFAAQVLATIACLSSKEFCKEKLGRDEPVGEIDPKKLNVNGGSIAIGHPFSATGGRVVLGCMNELRRTGKRYGLISICAAGGLGGVCILEHNPNARNSDSH
jgi:acetyl-CoA acyltransferase